MDWKFLNWVAFVHPSSLPLPISILMTSLMEIFVHFVRKLVMNGKGSLIGTFICHSNLYLYVPRHFNPNIINK